MDAIWQFLGVVALAAVGWLQVKSWRKGREIDALKRAEAERKAAEAAMVAEATRRLQAARDAWDKVIDAKNRDDFKC